jgi:TRAP-type mannitol/chloroaromatic compound transport system permease small subunit
MTALLSLSRLIDRLSEFIGRWVAWLVLAAVLISTANALSRKLLNISSNAYLEIQWYLFAAVFLLAAGYTLLRQEHVRIDVILGKFSRRTQVKIELFGYVVFLLPFVVAIFKLVMPLVLQAYQSGDLIRWPVYALVPAGFALLGLQGISEIIKRIAFLQGRAADPGQKLVGKTAEQELAEEIRRLAETQAAQGGKP